MIWTYTTTNSKKRLKHTSRIQQQDYMQQSQQHLMIGLLISPLLIINIIFLVILFSVFFFKNAHSSIKTKTATTTCGQEIFSSKKQTKKNLFIKAWDSLLGLRVVKKTKNRPENRFRRRRSQIQNPVFTAMYPLKIQFFLTRTTKKYQQKKKKFLFSVLFILKKKGKKFKRKKKS